MTKFEPKNEGACLLYDGVTQKQLWGINPRGCTHNVRTKYPQPSIGYLAYPDSTSNRAQNSSSKLKNSIPNTLFYQYDKLHKARGPIPKASNATYTTTGKLEQSVTKAQYIKKIHQIKELLAAGEVYQINYAIRFRKKFKGDPYALFQEFTKTNPASFSAYLNCGDFQIVSASPERLFKVQNNLIIAEPIKGTAPKKGGKKSLEKLIASEKERAELDMITDLSRNDIGKLCKYGTLKLTKEREILELTNLWHTYSQVQGQLTPNTSVSQICNALFPGGSITGCPKIRAMHNIQKLEQLPRNIFTGSIGYIKPQKITSKKSTTNNALPTADFNIAIRTALIQNGYVEYWAGGGIVADSDPASEYAECMLKAEKFLALL